MGVWRLRYEKDGLARIEELESSKLKLQVPNIALYIKYNKQHIVSFWLMSHIDFGRVLGNSESNCSKQCQTTNLLLN
jgi:hypothetical protein